MNGDSNLVAIKDSGPTHTRGKLRSMSKIPGSDEAIKQTTQNLFRIKKISKTQAVFLDE